jgi:Zn-finger protein
MVSAHGSTTDRALAPTRDADQTGCATVHYYDVGAAGSGKPYSALSQVPWSTLKGCDTVRIFAKPDHAPYNEMILVSAGSNLTPTAPDQFMRVVGVPDPVTHALPIIDGTNATQLETLPGSNTPRPLQYYDRASTPPELYQRGLVTVSRQAGSSYSYGPAGYVSIENLDIRNANYGEPFHYAEGNTIATYIAFTACLNIEAGAHIVVKGNVLHNCGNGLFINSKNHVLQELSQDILVQGNSIYANSNAAGVGGSGGHSEHNSYTEVRGITFEHNYFGNVKPGARGDCLKDRSSGLIVRYNIFASTCGIQLHLVDSTGAEQLIYDEPDYDQTYVYGNLFDISDASGGEPLLSKYGGDSGVFQGYRNGTLYFYNNTFAVRANASTSGAYATAYLFKLSMAQAVADVRNNVFYTTPVTAGAAGAILAVTIEDGMVNLADNWFSPNAAPYWLGHPSPGVVNGWSSNIGTDNVPGFVDYAQHDFNIVAGSPLVDRGGDVPVDPANLPRELPGLLPGALRPADAHVDVGALEYFFLDRIFTSTFE